MITHSLQSEIDKKSYCALDQDFDTAKLSSRLVTAESCLVGKERFSILLLFKIVIFRSRVSLFLVYASMTASDISCIPRRLR